MGDLKSRVRDMSVAIGMAFSAGGFLSFFRRADRKEDARQSEGRRGGASIFRLQDGAGHAIAAENCVSLLPLIDRCVSLCQSIARERNIDIKIDVSPNVPRTVVCDGDHLAQMLRLLIENAIETNINAKCAFVVDVDPVHRNNVLQFSVANRTAERKLLAADMPVEVSDGADLAEPKEMPDWLRLAALLNGHLTVVRRSGKAPVLVFSAPMPAVSDIGMG
jgi:hypothetical protein